MTSKWDSKRDLLVHAVARNIGPFGVQWDKVAEEREESPKACESAFWRDAQAHTDAKILKFRIKGVPYAKMLPHFPGMTIADLKERARKLAGQENNRWIEDEKIGFFDIEVSRTEAELGILLAWCLKLKDGEILEAAITREEAIDRDKQDRRVMEELLGALAQVDLVVTYWGTGMDNPWVRTRAMMLGLPFFKYGEKYHFDAYYAVKSKMRLRSKSLRVATQTLGIEGKTDLPPAIWMDARLGYPDAVQYVLEHCRADVIILEQLFNAIEPFVKITRKSL